MIDEDTYRFEPFQFRCRAFSERRYKQLMQTNFGFFKDKQKACWPQKQPERLSMQGNMKSNGLPKPPHLCVCQLQRLCHALVQRREQQLLLAP